MEETLRLHGEEVFRSCSNCGPRSGGVHQWLHPNDASLGQLSLENAWYETDCWLSEDLQEFLDSLGGELNAYAVSNLVGEIDDYLYDAEIGALRQESYWRRGEVCRVASQEGLLEIRLPTPIDLLGGRFRMRLCYSEPDCFEGLVSLHLHAKNIDDVLSKQLQNDEMDLAQRRGNGWVARFLDTGNRHES